MALSLPGTERGPGVVAGPVDLGAQMDAAVRSPFVGPDLYDHGRRPGHVAVFVGIVVVTYGCRSRQYCSDTLRAKDLGVLVGGRSASASSGTI